MWSFDSRTQPHTLENTVALISHLQRPWTASTPQEKLSGLSALSLSHNTVSPTVVKTVPQLTFLGACRCGESMHKVAVVVNQTNTEGAPVPFKRVSMSDTRQALLNCSSLTTRVALWHVSEAKTRREKGERSAECYRSVGKH